MANNKIHNFYTILNSTPTNSLEQIRHEYHLLSRKYHPDRANSLSSEEEAKYRLITEAYDTLKDEDKRKIYDVWLMSGIDIQWDAFRSMNEAQRVMHWCNKRGNRIELEKELNLEKGKGDDKLIDDFRNYRI